MPSDRARLLGAGEALDDPGAEHGAIPATAGHGVHSLDAQQSGGAVPGECHRGAAEEHRRGFKIKTQDSGAVFFLFTIQGESFFICRTVNLADQTQILKLRTSRCAAEFLGVMPFVVVVIFCRVMRFGGLSSWSTVHLIQNNNCSFAFNCKICCC